jgi:choline dehydrogenase-like flavoprotein
MGRITVVGSGASGVHFALSLLERGHEVQMVDVGYDPQPPPLLRADLNGLKAELEDPVEYFLGSDFETLVLPDEDKEYYGFPPSKTYVFRQPENTDSRAEGFSPIYSYAKGGLAQAWTGGVYPFSDEDLSEFPFGYVDLEPYYSEVARRIGVCGTEDDLARVMPVHEHLLPPLDLDPHSRLLLRKYSAQRSHFNEKLGCYLGRSRVATLSEKREGREVCDYLGRCLWGCPVGALYTPSMTLEDCFRYPQFTYVGDSWVECFSSNGMRRISSITTRSLGSGRREQIPVETLALAAGTLSTSRIFLASLVRSGTEPVLLEGLMDNRQVLLPFLNLALVGKSYSPASYQYHQLAIALESEGGSSLAHGLVTALTTAPSHPIIATMPVDLRTAVLVFRDIRAALGLVNLNFHDYRRSDCTISLMPADDGRKAGVPIISYSPPTDEGSRMHVALRRTRKALRRLGCLVPPGSAHVRPMGASVHYAGTIPMSEKPVPLTVSPICRSHDFENLFVVDGTTFPFLPAKNITFTLMANAARIADLAF